MSTDAKPVIFCQPVEQTWWSQKCPSAACDHTLLAHRSRTVWMDADGKEILLPVGGEAVELPAGAVKIKKSECSLCNLNAAVGELHFAMATMSNHIADFAQAMRNAQAKTEDKIGEILAVEPPMGESWPVENGDPT